MTEQYRIISAHYANEDGTAVIIMTEDSGAVAISERDRPELWKKLMNSGVEIGPMPVEPSVASKDTTKPIVGDSGEDTGQ